MRSDVPVFLIVTIFGKDVLPILVELKLTDIGETEILGGGALPESLAVTVDFKGSLDKILTVALFLP